MADHSVDPNRCADCGKRGSLNADNDLCLDCERKISRSMHGFPGKLANHPDRCPVCGHVRHSLWRWVKGWFCYRLFLLWPTGTPLWLFQRVADLLLPSAGDFMFDRRGWCDREHGREGKLIEADA